MVVSPLRLAILLLSLIHFTLQTHSHSSSSSSRSTFYRRQQQWVPADADGDAESSRVFDIRRQLLLLHRGLFRQRGGGGGSSDSNYSEGDLSACPDDERRPPPPPPPQQKILDGEFASTDDDVDNDATAKTSSTSISSSLTGGQHLSYSAYSIQGERQYMEDEYFVEQNGRFAAVFDGHGGGSVSKYLRQNLYANFQAALPQSASKKSSTVINITNQKDGNTKGVEESTMAQQYSNAQSSIVASALETAFDKVDNEVGSISHWSFQGSTALAIAIHENIHGNDDDTASTRYIVAANVGDSRAILSRGRAAIDLTKDHKPNDESERDRIESLGGTVDWCGEVNSKGHPIEHTGVYRINGNLALSRSIGDRSERPWVTNAVDITHFLVDEERDAFVLLATDGLYDVMSSRDIVTFVHDLMDRTTNPERRQELRHDIAKYVAEEALRRGTTDNVTVLVLWLNNFS